MDNITINVDINGEQTIDTVKKLKKHIDELKDSMVVLTEGTAEWNAVNNEVAESQEHLNNVLKAGKKQNEALAGSYDSLQQEMTKLRKQWKATNDEAERNELGQQILKINNQLKDYDASIGNFQRNVGDYEGAFKRAFGSISNILSTSSSEALRSFGSQANLFANLAKNAKDLKVGLKEMAGAFTSAGESVKGFAGTLSNIGNILKANWITILVIGVGELIANWDKLISMFDSSNKTIMDNAKSIEVLTDRIKRLSDISTLEASITYMNKVLEINTKYNNALNQAANDDAKRQELIKKRDAELLAAKQEYGDNLHKLNNSIMANEKATVTKSLSSLSELLNKYIKEFNAKSLDSFLGEDTRKVSKLAYDNLKPIYDRLITFKEAISKGEIIPEDTLNQIKQQFDFITKSVEYNGESVIPKYNLDKLTEEFNKVFDFYKEYLSTVNSDTKALNEEQETLIKNNIEEANKIKEKTKALEGYNKTWEDLLRTLKGQQNNNLAEQIALINEELITKTIPNIKKVGSEAGKSNKEISNAIGLAVNSANEKIQKLKDDNDKLIRELEIEFENVTLNVPPIKLSEENRKLLNESTQQLTDLLYATQFEMGTSNSKAIKDFLQSIVGLYTQVQMSQNEVELRLQQERETRLDTLDKVLEKYKAATGKELMLEEEKLQFKQQLNEYYDKKISQESVLSAEQANNEVFNYLLSLTEKRYNNWMDKLNYSRVVENEDGGYSLKNEEYNILGDNIYQEWDKQIEKIKGSQYALTRLHEESTAIIDKELANENISLQHKIEVNDMKIKLDEEYNSQYNNLLQQQKQMEAQAANAKIQFWASQGSNALNQIGSMLTSLGDLYGDDLEKQKKLQIAGATVQGLAGMATAVATAMQLGPIIGPIIGSINAAMVAASTAIQIAKIKQTTEESAASLSTTTANASYLNTETTASLLGTETTYDLQSRNTQPVWVSVKDINSVQSSVKVSQNESKF